MIQGVKLKNFQSHRSTELEFSDGINLIVGNSRSGKTSIIRSIVMNRYNKPRGSKAFNSHWNRDDKNEPKEEFYSEVIIDDLPIRRERSKSFNGYTCGKEKWAALDKVPEFIEDAYNTSEINIQKQFDKPFLISESSAEVSRFLNKIIKLDKIDVVLSKAEKERLALDRASKKVEDDIFKKVKELEQLDWLEEAEKLYKLCSDLKKKSIEDEIKASKLDQMLMRFDEIESEFSAIPKNLEAVSKAISEVEELIKKDETNATDIEDFNSVITDFDNLVLSLGKLPKGEILEEAEMILENIKSLEEIEVKFSDEVTDLNLVINEVLAIEDNDDIITEDEIEAFLAVKNRIDDLIEIEAKNELGLLNACIVNIEDTMLESNELEKEINEIRKELPKVCEYCGSSLEGK